MTRGFQMPWGPSSATRWRQIQAFALVAAPIDVELGGKVAVVVSAVVAVLLTPAAYGAGWVPITLPVCRAAKPFACVQGWLATAGAALGLANVLYAAVYGRVFGGGEGGACGLNGRAGR